MCRIVFPVSLMNGLFKTTFWANLSHWLHKLHLPWYCPVSVRNRLFKTIFWVKLSYRLDQHYLPEEPQKYLCIYFPQVRMIEMRCNMMVWLSDTTGVSFGIMSCWWHQQWHLAFLTSRKLKWGTMTFIIMWCYWCWALVSHDVEGIINGAIQFLKWIQLKWGTTCLFPHVVKLVLASHDANTS